MSSKLSSAPPPDYYIGDVLATASTQTDASLTTSAKLEEMRTESYEKIRETPGPLAFDYTIAERVAITTSTVFTTNESETTKESERAPLRELQIFPKGPKGEKPDLNDVILDWTADGHVRAARVASM